MTGDASIQEDAMAEQENAPNPGSENAGDSANPGKKSIDDTRESSEERREHPGTADSEEGSD